MSKNAIKYLEEYKDKFSKEDLIVALKKVGYTAKDIDKSIDVVYTERSIQTPFTDFSSIKNYVNKEEKNLDYIFGVLLPWFLGILLAWINIGLIFINLIVYVFFVTYFKKRRYYIFRGLLLNFYIVLVLVFLFFIISSLF